MKRVFDFLVALVVIIIFLPLGLFIMFVLLCTGEHEIFFLHERVGKGERRIKLFKFATMLKNSPHIGTGDITVENDPRVLPFGKFLRKTKLNEVPQILNILIGDMSIVGPRPLAVNSFYTYYTMDEQKIISSIQPGLTGIGSIVFRDEEAILKNTKKDPVACYKEDIMPYKAKLEIWYKEHRSFWVDIKLMFLTAYVILFPKSKIYEKIFDTLPKKHF